MSRFAHLMEMIFDTPLLVSPRKLAIFYNSIITERIGTGQMELPEEVGAAIIDSLQARGAAPKPTASRFFGSQATANRGGRTVGEPFMVDRGVGIITITGALVNRGAYIGSNSGQTSYEGIKHQLARAGDNSSVKSVILDIESPGGTAIGAFDAAAAVRQLTAQKRTIAVVNGIATSGAYALAAGASRIVTTSTGIVGSIGVALMHMDISKALETAGLKPTLIFAGAHKRDGNPFAPLPDDVRQTLQADVMQIYEEFLGSVAAGRPRRTPVSVARATEAQSFTGRAGVDARLADDVGTFEEVLADLARRGSRTGSAKAQRSGAMLNLSTMKAEAVNEGVDVVLATEANAAIAAARQEGIEEGKKAGAAAGATAAQTRLTTILSSEHVKGKEAYALELAQECPDLSAEKIISLVSKVPGVTVTSVAQRAAASNVNGVSGAQERPADVGTDDRPSVDIAGSPWNTAIRDASASIAAQNVR